MCIAVVASKPRLCELAVLSVKAIKSQRIVKGHDSTGSNGDKNAYFMTFCSLAR